MVLGGAWYLSEGSWKMLLVRRRDRALLPSGSLSFQVRASRQLSSWFCEQLVTFSSLHALLVLGRISFWLNP